MSHFTVLIVGENAEEQLKPFQENNMGDCPIEYLTFNDNQEENEKDYAEKTRTFWQAPDGERYSTWDDRFKVKNESGIGTKNVKPDDYVQIEVPFKEIYPTFEAYMENYCEQKRDSKTNRYGYWENPNAKWDWYQIGGRWAGMFTLKEGATGKRGDPSWMQRMGGKPYPEGKVDIARKGDIDFEAMRQEKMEKAALEYDRLITLLGIEVPTLKYKWKEILDAEEFSHLDIKQKRDMYHSQPELKALNSFSTDSKLSKEDQSFIAWLEFEDYCCTREEFIKRAGDASIATFALIKDGVWYEKGSMGWWGMVSDEKNPTEWQTEFGKLLDSIPEETLLTVVDCHI